MKSGFLRVLCATATVFGVAALSRAPYTPPAAETAALRFSWRMSVTARENCRPRNEEELARLPVHMRTPEVCLTERATYSLVTSVGSAPPDTAPLIRGGVNGDRPVFVLEERHLLPGRHRVHVGVHRMTDSAADELLASLDTVLTFRTGGVELVTLDPDGKRLIVLSSVRGDGGSQLLSRPVPGERRRSRR